MSWFAAHLIGWTIVKLLNVICHKCEGIRKTSSVPDFSKIHNPFKKVFGISHKSLCPWEKAVGFETVWTGSAENLRHLERFTQECKLWIIGHSNLNCWRLLAHSSEPGFLFPHCKSCSVLLLICKTIYHSQFFVGQSKVLLTLKWKSRNFLLGHSP